EIAKFCGTTGEPFINPVIIEGIELFKKLGKKIIIYTNGLNLEKKVENNGRLFLDYILEANKLNLSLDAGSEETFTKLKGSNGFSRIIKSLDKLVEKREKNDSDLNIVVSYVIGRKNYNEVVNATKIIRDIGADEIIFRVDFTDPKGIREISDIIINNLNEAKEYSNNGFKVNCAYSENEITKDDSAFHSYGRKCFTHYFWACIGPDCELYACGHRTHGEVKSYGSLLDNSFRKLWINRERSENIKKLPDEHC
ncbi:unnamed protein product, partial [marine sediment metagenome]